jgi:hypothetical protein
LVFNRSEGEIQRERPQQHHSALSRQIQHIHEKLLHDLLISAGVFDGHFVAFAVAALIVPRLLLEFIQELAHIRGRGVFQVRSELGFHSLLEFT